MEKKFDAGFEKKNPPRNLRTHLEETMAAMAEIEGEGWLYDQKKSSDANTIHAAREYLERANEESGLYAIYGSGGGNRWYVRPDGSVEFSRHHATRGGTDDAGDIRKAKDLGFKIFD